MSVDMLLDERVTSTNPISLIIYFFDCFNSVVCNCFFQKKHSMLILGTMNATRSHTYRPYLSEGSIYSLSGFEVTQSNNNFHLSDAHVSIRFSDGTTFVELTTSY